MKILCILALRLEKNAKKCVPEKKVDICVRNFVFEIKKILQLPENLRDLVKLYAEGWFETFYRVI